MYMFKGIYTPIVTPFKENGKIDFENMKHNIEKWKKTNLDGLVVLGSNGEFVYLSTEEKLQVVDFVIKEVNKTKKIIVGTGCESTTETILLSNKVAKLGADAVLVLPPHYYKKSMNDQTIYNYFIDIAKDIEIPIMIYNMPGNTGINLSSELISKLSRHPNIIGIKDTAGNIVQLSEIVRDTDEDFTVFAGNAGYLLPALSIGARGATIALANCLPDECCKLVDLFNKGELEKAKKLQLAMIKINYYVTGLYGIPALKEALNYLGYKGGLPRKPLQLLDDSKKEELINVIKSFKKEIETL